MAQDRTLPMLLLNLGGEMVYILEQRLQSQRVAEDKAVKVLEDICRLLLHERFLVELLVPQPLGHSAALKTFFRDLAHSSIMRLDDDSMAKMWDLMTMAVKLQALRADSPGELLQATLNHIDYIGEHVPAVRAQAESAAKGLQAFYGRMSSGELQSVRYCILNYLQGLAVRVSLFLKHGMQDMHGRLLAPKDGPVPPGCEPPGTLRVMDGGGREVDSVVQVIHFTPGGQFTTPARDSGPGANSELGFNMYSELENPGGPAGAAAAARRHRRRSSVPGAAGLGGALVDAQGHPLYVGREELNMLMAQLLGNRPSPRDKDKDVPIRLIVSLFDSGDAEPIHEEDPGPSHRPQLPEAAAPPRSPGAAGTSSTAASGSMVSIDASGSAGSRSARLQQVLADLDASAAADPHDDGAGAAGDAEDGAGAGYLDLWDDLEQDEDEGDEALLRPLL